ncbi:hypothetical protein MFRU_045g00720 [Monilinia fructicola]|nr:hypothetical protein MFRU_045g00720 [Monilinia fructicola]
MRWDGLAVAHGYELASPGHDSTQAHDSPKPTLRRNGKLPSCEPCRVGKLACGHEQPYCGRCVRRGLESRCWYHPAPMSRGKGGKMVGSDGGIERGVRDGGGEVGSGGRVEKRRRLDGRIGGGAGLDGLADAAIMRDEEREEGRIGEEMNIRNGNVNPITNDPTTLRATPFVGTEPTTKNQSATQNPTGFPATKPPTTSVYRSSRGCSSPHPRREHNKQTRPNIQNSTFGIPTVHNNWSGAIYPRSRRYWGPTSFGAVFRDGGSGGTDEWDVKSSGDISKDGPVGTRFRDERMGNEALGGMLDIGEEGRRNPSSWPFGQPLLGRNRPTSYSVRCEMITKALWNIPSLSSCNRLLERYHDLVEFSIMPEFMIKYLVTTIYSTFGSVLAEPRSKEKFIPFVETLLKNEETPLPPSPDDGIAWLDTFSGSNIRFEAIGLLFCFIGRAYQSLADGDPLFQKEENHGRNRRQTSWRMNECADVMGKMCDCTDTVNEIVVAFRVAIFVLESSVVGDECYGNLNRHGNMITSACAIGLHRLPHIPPHLLTTAAEYKRRVFASVYSMDKCSSALNGTPPGIPRLYCRLQMPSDLSETELFLPRTEMQQAIANCDEHGWNKKGEIHCGTYYRVSLQNYMVKEEILEGALGVDVQVSRERIDSLLARASSLSQSRPPQFQFNVASTGRLLLVQLSTRLETLQNTFLLHRLALANHLDGNYNQGLLDTAMEMLEKVIMMWEKRDALVGFEYCFDWFVTNYGIPAAGVICVELLKLTSTKSENTRTEHERGERATRFPKSVAIQKLTLFAAFLDWVRQTDGNYALLKRVRGVVGRVLKWVLDGGEMNREVEREKGKERHHSREDQSVGSQGAINPTLMEIEASTSATGNTEMIGPAPHAWNNMDLNFAPPLVHSSQTEPTGLDGGFSTSLDLDMGLESLEGIGMEEMWGQVDWLNAGDWMGGSGVGGVGNGSAGFGFAF